MSMEMMVQAMKIKVGNPLRKLVLLKLADNANDQGSAGRRFSTSPSSAKSPSAPPKITFSSWSKMVWCASKSAKPRTV